MKKSLSPCTSILIFFLPNHSWKCAESPFDYGESAFVILEIYDFFDFWCLFVGNSMTFRRKTVFVRLEADAVWVFCTFRKLMILIGYRKKRCTYCVDQKSNYIFAKNYGFFFNYFWWISNMETFESLSQFQMSNWRPRYFRNIAHRFVFLLVLYSSYLIPKDSQLFSIHYFSDSLHRV